MNFLNKLFLTLFILCGVLVGCDRTDSSYKRETKQPDGTKTVDERTVKTNDKGDVKVTEEHKVDRP